MLIASRIGLPTTERIALNTHGSAGQSKISLSQDLRRWPP